MLPTLPLPVTPAHALETRPEESRWLIEGLWTDQAVGIVGGEPKCCKSFLALDMAVAVASGAACLRRFRVVQTGRVVLFAAEDALHVVRHRLDGICLAAGVALADLDLQVITSPSLRLDLPEDRERLAATIETLRPRMLLLDPFVRLHRIDENVAGEVAPLLAYLRELQRRFGLAVVVVHHARKGAAKTRGGQALRGSSEFHAWVDVTLYLRRTDDRLSLSIEHRAAPSAEGLPIALKTDGDALALEVVDALADATASSSAASDVRESPLAKIERVLAAATEPLPLDALRQACRIRTATLYESLNLLASQGRINKTPVGYCLATATTR